MKSYVFSKLCLPPAFTLGFLLGVFFDSEDWGEMFFQNTGRLSIVYIP
jgi:hypothetical protein